MPHFTMPVSRRTNRCPRKPGAAHSQIEVFYLPAYSPELNPDEGINGDLKQAVPRKPPARSRPDLQRNVISHMRRLSKSPKRIRSLFQNPAFRYAA